MIFSSDNPGLRFKLSLRSDVYFLVRTSDQSTDKIEGSVVWYGWDNHEIFVLLVKRIETFFGRTPDADALMKMKQTDLARYLEPVMEPRFTGRGKWENAPVYRVLMSLIRKRPRDLVKLLHTGRASCRRAKRQLHNDRRFSGPFLRSTLWGAFRTPRMNFGSELPDIGRLVMNMKPNKAERIAKAGYVYKTDALLKKIGNIMEQGAFRMQNGAEAERRGIWLSSSTKSTS